MSNLERLENFLKELSELSIKYDLWIKGCGCCGSPWIFDGKNCTNCADNLSIDTDDTYYVEENDYD